MNHLTKFDILYNNLIKWGEISLKKIKKGDIVGRISYGKDILFVVDRIIKTTDKNEFAILKGLTVRIKADSPINDLEVVEKRIVQENIKLFENKIENRLRKCLYCIESDKRSRRVFNSGRILHLDGECIFVYIFNYW